MYDIFERLVLSDSSCSGILLTTEPRQYVYFCISLNLRTVCFFSMALSPHVLAFVQEQVVINHEPGALSEISLFSDFLVFYCSIHNNKLQQPCTRPLHVLRLSTHVTRDLLVCHDSCGLTSCKSEQNWILRTTFISLRQLFFLFLFGSGNVCLKTCGIRLTTPGFVWFIKSFYIH